MGGKNVLRDFNTAVLDILNATWRLVWPGCIIGERCWGSLPWRRAHHTYTCRYRVPNWRIGNQVLIDRGGNSWWIDETALAAWRNSQVCSESGVPRIFSDTASQCALVVKIVYGLTLGAAQSFGSSVMSLMRRDLPVPHYRAQCVGDRGHSGFRSLCPPIVGRVTL